MIPLSLLLLLLGLKIRSRHSTERSRHTKTGCAGGKVMSRHEATRNRPRVNLHSSCVPTLPYDSNRCHLAGKTTR